MTDTIRDLEIGNPNHDSLGEVQDHARSDDERSDDARSDTLPDNVTQRRRAVSDAFQKTCIDIITPALETDVRDMIRGRVLWRRVSTVFEVLGRVSGAGGTVLAFAGGSDLPGETLSRALAFSAGCLGTVSIVSTLFASFSRQQSMERSTAVNSILQAVGVETIPDVSKALDIQGTNND